MKKVFSLILALGLIASLTACGGGNASGNETGDSAPAASTAKLRFVTGGESGTYYAFGSVIAQHATNNTDVSVTGLVGNGSKSNVEELADGNAELAFCQSDVMAYAYNGTNLFENPIDCFSTVAALYMEDVQIVTTDPSIKTVADLAGKNVSVGAAGSGVYFNAVDILSAYGLGDLDADGKFTKINAIMGEEIFGPILPILTYESLDEAIQTVESHPHPLALYFFSEDKAAQKKVLDRCHFGGGCINDTIIHLATSAMQFGGVGESGMGGYHGQAGFDEFTHYRSIVDKKTWMDLPVRYQRYNKFKRKMLRMFLK